MKTIIKSRKIEKVIKHGYIPLKDKRETIIKKGNPGQKTK